MRKTIAAGVCLVAAVGAGVAARGLHPGGATASSHAEAPLISQDPTADNTDLYAFGQPGQSDSGHDRRQLDPVRGAGRRPELPQVRRRPAATSSRSTTTATPGRRDLQLPVQDQGPEPEHVPLQHGPGHEHRRLRELERPPVTYTMTRDHERQGARCSASRASASRPRTSALARPRTTPRSRPGRHEPSGRHEGLRRSARRSVLRRPRLDLRPGRPAAPQQPPHPAAAETAAGVDGLKGYNVHSIALQIPIAMLTRDGKTHAANEPRNDRHLDEHEPKATTVLRQRHAQEARATGCRSRASATRSSTKS